MKALPYWQNRITNFCGDVIDNHLFVKEIKLYSYNFDKFIEEFRKHGAVVESNVSSIDYYCYYCVVKVKRVY